MNMIILGVASIAVVAIALAYLFIGSSKNPYGFDESLGMHPIEEVEQDYKSEPYTRVAQPNVKIKQQWIEDMKIARMRDEWKND